MPEEVAARNTGDPSANRDGVHAEGEERGPKSRVLGSQSVHKSASNAAGKRANQARGGAKAGNDRWSKGTQGDGSEMKGDEEHRPARVAVTPKQAGETLRQKWSWVELSVWTDRMLTALETGSKETSCEQQGLYSLVAAQGLIRQSRTEKPSIGEPDAGKPPVRF